MSKFLLLLSFTILSTCEKPAPQKPKVVWSEVSYDTISKVDTIKQDSIPKLRVINDSLAPQDSIKAPHITPISEAQ